jgi:hypothetical protein
VTPFLVSWNPSSFALGVVQVRASQGRRGRDTGSYVDRGERREVRAWAAPSVKRLGFHGTRHTSLFILRPLLSLMGRDQWGCNSEKQICV